MSFAGTAYRNDYAIPARAMTGQVSESVNLRRAMANLYAPHVSRRSEVNRELPVTAEDLVTVVRRQHVLTTPKLSDINDRTGRRRLTVSGGVSWISRLQTNDSRMSSGCAICNVIGRAINERNDTSLNSVGRHIAEKLHALVTSNPHDLNPYCDLFE